MKLKRLLILVPVAFSLKPGVSFSQEHTSDSFAHAATAFGSASLLSATSMSTSSPAFACPVQAVPQDAAAAPDGGIDAKRSTQASTNESHEDVAGEEELGREPYRMLLAVLGVLLFSASRRKSGDWP